MSFPPQFLSSSIDLERQPKLIKPSNHLSTLASSRSKVTGFSTLGATTLPAEAEQLSSPELQESEPPHHLDRHLQITNEFHSNPASGEDIIISHNEKAVCAFNAQVMVDFLQQDFDFNPMIAKCTQGSSSDD